MLDLEIVGEGATTKIYRDGNMAIMLYVNAPPDEASIFVSVGIIPLLGSSLLLVKRT